VWAIPFSLSSLEVSGEPFPVSAEAGSVSISRDGTLVYLGGASGQEVQLVWVGRDGSLSEPITDLTPSLFAASISPDGRRLALCEYDGSQVDIWIHDLERRTRTRFTFGEANQMSPEWTPDGSHLLYYDSRTDTIRSRRADGTGLPTAVTKGRDPSLSSDGRYLVYHVQAGTNQQDLWYLELGGQSEAKPLVATPANEQQVRISRDGRYVAYASDESGSNEIYITRFPTGEGKWQVSTNGGDRPRWAADGTKLYYQEESCRLMEVPMTLDPSPVLGTPLKVLDCAELGLFSGFGREFEIDLDGSRFLWTKSPTPQTGRIDVGITFVENWAKEFTE
jgi:Tol biopolymer transport system component